VVLATTTTMALSADLKAEIARHTSELESLQEQLPAGISLGLAFVNTSKASDCDIGEVHAL
jgi:hypothetical protein